MAYRSALLLVCALAGCARAPAGLVPLPYGATTPAAADSVRYNPARFLALPPLDRTALPAGTRELRLWHPPGMIQPQHMTRVVENAEGVSVQQVTYWPDGPESLEVERFLVGMERDARRQMGCRRIEQRGGMKLCIGRPITGARARAIVARLDSLGAWAPPPRRALVPGERQVIDGPELWVEARVGSEYRGAHYADGDFTAGGIVRRLASFTDLIPIR